MVKVSFQNNKNWVSYKCLVRKSEKMCLSQNFSKIWDVKFQGGLLKKEGGLDSLQISKKEGLLFLRVVYTPMHTVTPSI